MLRSLTDWLSRPFWNSTERRLRAGWRILIHFMAWVFAYSLVQVAAGRPIAALVQNWFPELTELADRILLLGVMLGLFLFFTWAVVRYIDRRPLTDLGLQMDRIWWADCGFGLVLGAVVMSLVFLVEYWAGWIEIQAVFFVEVATLPFALAILGPMMVFLLVGISEELLFRGHQLRNLAEGLYLPGIGPRKSVVLSWLISSALFGLFHIFNPYADWISTLNLAILGLMFGLGFVLTGRLGLPIGLHITWNFFMGNVFGFPVSGNDFTTATVFAIRQGGPPIWTGGPFGPEAGLIGILAIMITCWAIVLWVRRRYARVELDLNLAYYGQCIGIEPAAKDQPASYRPGTKPFI